MSCVLKILIILLILLVVIFIKIFCTKPFLCCVCILKWPFFEDLFVSFLSLPLLLMLLQGNYLICPCCVSEFKWNAFWWFVTCFNCVHLTYDVLCYWSPYLNSWIKICKYPRLRWKYDCLQHLFYSTMLYNIFKIW